MRTEDAFKQKALNSALWKFLDKIGTQVAQFIIQIVLARLLLPSDYGLIGLLTIFIAISDVFIQQGFATALIQKKDVDDLDYSSVFFANIFLSFILYGILFLIAPLVANFYNQPQLTSLMRVLSLSVIFGAIGAVHNAIMAKNLQFKKSFFRGLANTLTYGTTGIVLACLGFGVWSLVYSRILGVLVGSLVLCFTVNWKPSKCFSAQRIKNLFGYSSKIVGTNVLNTAFNNVHSLIIGKFFTANDLGYYQKGQSIPQTAMTAVDGSLNEVLFPTLSALQDDMDRLKSTLRRSLKLSIFFVFPMLIGIIVVAKPLVVILLTEKWLPCVPYMQLSCVVCLFWPFSARRNALNALGKSNVTFWVSIISKGLTIIGIVACIPFGVFAIMLGTICASSISFIIMTFLTKKYIRYYVNELIKDILPAVLLSAVMGVAVYCVQFIGLSDIITLLIQVPLGVVIYVGGAKIFKMESFDYILRLIKGFFAKRKHVKEEQE